MGEQQHREVNRRAGEHRGPICSCGAEFKVRPGSHTQLSRYPHSGQSVDSAKSRFCQEGTMKGERGQRELIIY